MLVYDRGISIGNRACRERNMDRSRYAYAAIENILVMDVSRTKKPESTPHTVRPRKGYKNLTPFEVTPEPVRLSLQESSRAPSSLVEWERLLCSDTRNLPPP